MLSMEEGEYRTERMAWISKDERICRNKKKHDHHRGRKDTPLPKDKDWDSRQKLTTEI